MKLTDQILATAYSATFAVFEPIRDFLPGSPNLFHLRHHYATEGVPLTTADVESSTGASRQRFSKALKFLQNEGFIDTNDSRYNNIGVRLLPKGHDEGTLLCSVRPVSSSNAYLELMLNLFQVLDREPNCSDWLNETLLTGVNYGQPETKTLLSGLQVAMTQLSICGLVESGSSIKRHVSYRFRPEGLELAQRPGNLPDGYKQLKSGHTDNWPLNQTWQTVDRIHHKYCTGKYADDSEIGEIPLPVSGFGYGMFFFDDMYPKTELQD